MTAEKVVAAVQRYMDHKQARCKPREWWAVRKPNGDIELHTMAGLARLSAKRDGEVIHVREVQDTRK